MKIFMVVSSVQASTSTSGALCFICLINFKLLCYLSIYKENQSCCPSARDLLKETILEVESERKARHLVGFKPVIHYYASFASPLVVEDTRSATITSFSFSPEFSGLERPHSGIPRMTLKWNIVETKFVLGLQKLLPPKSFLKTSLHFTFPRKRKMNPDIASFLANGVVSWKKVNSFLCRQREKLNKSFLSPDKNWKMVA